MIEPARTTLRDAGAMGGFDVFGNVLVLTPPEHHAAIAAALPAEVNRAGQWAASCSLLPNDAGLVYKVLGMETEPVRDHVRQAWEAVRRETVGRDVPQHFLWR